MLHVPLRCGQVRTSWLATFAAACLLSLAADVQAAPDAGLAQAEALAREGRHLEAAARYEQLARRTVFGWDARNGLLAAREYAAAGEPDEAARVLDKVRSRARSDEDRALLALVDATLALDRGDAGRALAALDASPAGLPDEHAADLLELRGRAELAAGRPLAGIRTFERRGARLADPADRAANDRLLFDQLLLYPPASTVAPPGASVRERGWLELPVLVEVLGRPTVSHEAARQLQDWLARHPGHPGAGFLPRPAGTALAAAPTGPDATIALLLPLDGRQQAAAAAIRDGFLAAWFGTGDAATRPRVRIYDTSGGVAAAYARAVADGARSVVGPLLKEDVTALLLSQPAGLPVPTLALNSIGDTVVSVPAFLYQFSLDPEQEARAIAQRIAGDGHTRGVALFPDTVWGQRVRAAFVDEVQRLGTVTLTSAQWYGPSAQDFSAPLRAALGRYGGAGDRPGGGRGSAAARRDAAGERASGPQFAFLATPTPQLARALRPQLRFQMTYDVAVYATSEAWEAGARSAADLEGTIFPEMPWLLYGGQGAPELWDALHGEWAARSRGRARLYAFGYDAFQLARQLGSGASVAGVDGLTGLLEVSPADGRVRRAVQFARVEQGRAQPAGTASRVFLGEPVTNAAGPSPTP
jgi:uncharacterized protein